MSKQSNEDIYDPAFIENLFDQMSNSYERINILFSFGFTYFWRKAMLKNIIKPHHQDLEIIDLMAGMGETWNLIKLQFPNAQLTGLDISDGMLNRARKKNRERYNDQILITKADVLKNNLESEKYDLVLSAFGLKTFNREQIKVLATEVSRILKPNGQFAFIEISEPSHSFFNFFYRFYIGKVTPQITKVLLGDPKEYRMLWEYTKRYKNTQWVGDLFQQAGLTTHYDSYFFGCATGIHGTKP